MATRRTGKQSGSPQIKRQMLLIRLTDGEKRAFVDAADLAGISLSAWIRERLRLIAIRELEAAARPIAFLGDRDEG